MKRILSIIGVLIAIVAIGFVIIKGPGVSTSGPYPDHTKVRVNAPPASTGEDIRYITYKDKDSTVPEQVQIEYKSGVTGYIFYRVDGTIRETTEYYPAPEGSTQRQLRSGSLRTEDGKAFLSDRGFRADGTLVREGRRLPDGSYDVQYYFANGVSLQRTLLLDAAGKLVMDKVFYEGGAIKSSSQRDSVGRTIATAYFADGKKESVITVPANYYENVDAVYYFPDGVTMRLHVVYNNYGYAADYFREDGTLRLSSTESLYSTQGQAYWMHYDAKGKRSMRQSYRVEVKTDSAGKTVKTYLLRTSEELDANGNVIREISFAADGATPNRVRIPATPGAYWGGTIKTLRPDGTIEKVEVRNSRDDVVSTHTYTAAENKREAIPAHYLVRPNEPEPPTPPKKPEGSQFYFYDGNP